MKKILHYLSPMRHLGDRHYPILFPLLTMIVFSVLVELFVTLVLHQPETVGTYAIFPHIVLIIYFAFRTGMRGGFIAAGVTLLFYFYIVYSRNWTGEQLESGLNMIAILSALYFLLGGVIGILKERIDVLIDNEAGEKKRLQAILQQLPVGVIVANREGIVEQSNARVERVLGTKFITPDVRIGRDKNKYARFNGKSVTPSQWPLAKTLATGKAVSNKEYVIEREDGEKTYLDVSSAPIHNREGKMVAAASVFADITSQKLIEERKDDFISMASHELKTPLTSLKLYLELLKKTVEARGDAKELDFLERIADQITRLQLLVQDLLDVSRIQTGKLTFTREKVRLDHLIPEVVEVLQSTTEKQSITVVGKKPVVVYADKFRLYQVLTNLVTNAIKYSGSGKEIRIVTKKDRENVVVSVQDFGIGIAKNQQQKIFERLYQIGDGKGNTYPGFGMGLFITKEIIDRHKGKIWVESEKGKGSTFYFSLPISTN